MMMDTGDMARCETLFCSSITLEPCYELERFGSGPPSHDDPGTRLGTRLVERFGGRIEQSELKDILVRSF